MHLRVTRFKLRLRRQGSGVGAPSGSSVLPATRLIMIELWGILETASLICVHVI
jgi:hypothetical protein